MHHIPIKTNIYDTWQPQSIEVANSRLERIYNLLLHTPYCVDGYFNFDSLTIDASVKIVNTLPGKSIDAKKQMSEEFRRLLIIFAKEDIYKSVDYITTVDMLSSEAYRERINKTIDDKNEKGITWANILDVCKIVIADTKITRINYNRKLLCMWLQELPPLRVQDYVSATRIKSDNYIDGNIYHIGKFKTVNAFNKKYGNNGIRTIELSDKLAQYIQKGTGMYIFDNGRVDGYTCDGFANLIKGIFGTNMRTLRIIYASEIIPQLTALERGKAAYIMGHCLSTQIADYSKK